MLRNMVTLHIAHHVMYLKINLETLLLARFRKKILEVQNCLEK